MRRRGRRRWRCSRTGDLSQSAMVEVATSGGTAVSGVNYTSVSQELTFAAGQSSQTIAIAVKDAGVLSQPLTVGVVFEQPGGQRCGAGEPVVGDGDDPQRGADDDADVDAAGDAG